MTYRKTKYTYIHKGHISIHITLDLHSYTIYIYIYMYIYLYEYNVKTCAISQHAIYMSLGCSKTKRKK